MAAVDTSVDTHASVDTLRRRAILRHRLARVGVYSPPLLPHSSVLVRSCGR